MSVNSEEELEKLIKIGKIVARARDIMLENVKEGINTLELDKIGGEILEQYGALSAPQKDYSFPGFTCISINDEIAHGIPGNRILKKGDIINIDVSAELNGYYADTGATTIVGEEEDSKRKKLIEASRKALMKGIEEAKADNYLNCIGKAIHAEAKKNGFKVIRNLAGHGIGKKLHEEPDCILNYQDKSDRRKLKSGDVLAIETFLTNGGEYVVEDDHGWTLKTTDGSIGAQFEHTVIVTDGKPIVVTI